MNHLYTFMLIGSGFLLNSCNNALNVMGQDELSQRPAVTSLDKTTVAQGDTLQISGIRLSSSLTAKINDIKVPIEITSKSSAKILFGDALAPGVNKIEFFYKDTSISKFPILNAADIASVSISEIPAESLCDDIIAKTFDGTIIKGTRHCESAVACTVDGQVNCLAVEAFPSIDKSTILPKNIRSGATIAGVLGDYPSNQFPLLTADGTPDLPSFPLTAGNTNYQWFQANGTRVTGTIEADAVRASGPSTQILSNGLYRKVTITGDANLVASNIKSGITLLGVGGTLTGSPVNCSGDGELGCITIPSFPAVDTAVKLVNGNIKAGVTIAGVTGQYPSATYPLSAATATADLPAFTSTAAGTTYEWFNASGTRLTGTVEANISAGSTATDQVFNAGLYRQATVLGDANLVASKIISGTTTLGVAGSAVVESHTDCLASGVSGCLTTSTVTSLLKTDLPVGNLKKGVTLVGIVGDYPSATNPLTGNTATEDLTDARFNVLLKTTAPFEYFTSAGVLETTSGNAALVGTNIKSGVSFFGETGSAGVVDCAADGVVGCKTTTRYKSMDTDPSVISSWDIRKGKSTGGIAGDMIFYKNGVSAFNRTTGDGSAAGFDAYDTLDDKNDNGALPTTAFAGFTASSSAGWLRDPVSDTGLGVGEANNGLCDAGEDCVYQDRLTAAYWATSTGSLYTWEEAITYCDSLNAGSYSDYRLPTQKELMQLMIDGAWSVKQSSKLNLSGNLYWTSTTSATNTTEAWRLEMSTMFHITGSKTTPQRILCMRP